MGPLSNDLGVLFRSALTCSIAIRGLSAQNEKKIQNPFVLMARKGVTDDEFGLLGKIYHAV